MKKILFRTISTSEVQTKTAQFSAEYLKNALSKQPVLVLLSGGSALPMYEEMGKQLIAMDPSLEGLTISLFDERFVNIESPDSNAVQLKAKGLVELFVSAGATWLPYLVDNSETGPAVAKRVSRQFQDVLQTGAALVVFAGMGDDAHTAGLLPTSDEKTVAHLFNSDQLVAYYTVPEDAPNPYRHRLTSTPKLIQQAQQVIVYATGEKKQVALQRFIRGTEAIAQCPVISLLNSQSDVYFFTDQAA